jgi:UDP-perosamine 4-acetyltransferase
VEVLREMGLDVAGCVSGDGVASADLAAIGIEMLGTIDDLDALRTDHRWAFVAVGANGARRALADRATGLGFELVLAISTRATVSPSADIDAGALIMPGAIVNALAQVGAGAIVNTGAIIEHECRVGAFAHIAPGAKLAGAVMVGQEAMIGMGSQVLASRTIGQHAVVGAGAVVIHDVDEGHTVVGVPASRVIGRASVSDTSPSVTSPSVSGEQHGGEQHDVEQHDVEQHDVEQHDVEQPTDKIGDEIEPTEPPNVLVVCTGNLNRSPLVEALLQRELSRLGIEANVSSAGIAAPIGSQVDNKLHRVAVELGVGDVIDVHRSKQITPSMLHEADLVLVMTGEHLDELSRFGAVRERATTLRTAAWRSRVIGTTDLGFADWVARLTTDIGATRGNGLSADDVSDPIGGRLRQYRAMGTEVTELVGILVNHWGGR